MSVETVLEARLKARDEGLVGQLNATELQARGAKQGLDSMSTASRGLASATGQAAAGDRAAAAAARDLATARKSQERAARDAARAEQKAANEVARALSRRQTGQMQAGQQLQDFFIQIDGGTPILRAFSQQASQLQFAIAMMGGEVDGAQGRFAKFASFMAGPWGIALGVAIPLVSMLGAKLFENAAASEAAEAGADGLAAAQTSLGHIFDLVSGKLKTQNELLIINARLQAISLRADADKAAASAEAVTNRILQPGMIAETQLYGAYLRAQQSGDPNRFATIQDNRRKLQSLFQGVAQGGISRSEALRMSQGIDFDETGFDQSEVAAALRDGVVAELNRRAADLIDQSLDSGKLAGEFRKPGPKGRSRSGAGGARALEKFGSSAEERIARIADNYNPAPQGLDKAFTDLRTLDKLIADLGTRKPPSFEKLIGEAQQAREAVLAGISDPLDKIQQQLVPLPQGVTKARDSVRELDGIIAVLSERKPPNWEELVARAEDLKAVAADTVNGPLNDMLRQSREQRAQQLLVLQGREREAEVLARIQQLERDQGPLNADQRRAVEKMVEAEERINDLLVKRQDILSIYMASIGDLRGALEDLFSGGSGGDFLKNTEKMVRQLQGRLTVEALFGDSLRALEKKARGLSPLDREIADLAREIDSLEGEAGRSSKALKLFTDSLATATAAIQGGAANPHRLGEGSALRVFGGSGASSTGADGEIVVTGTAPASLGGALLRDQSDFVRELARAQVEPLAELFDKYLGSDFFRKLSPVFEGAYSGFFTAGPVGGLLGAVKDLPGLPKKLGDQFDRALGGAQTGTLVSGLGDLLGIKNSSTGAQLGGALGSFLPIPGGDIIGAVAGGLLGGLLKPSRSAGAVVTGIDSYRIGGKDTKNYGTAEGLAGSLTQGLQRIADALGGEVGSFYTTIGVRDGDYRVNRTGDSLKIKKGAKEFEDDAAGAIAYAIADAISDGGIKGISAAMQKALRSSDDIDKAIQEALKVRDVEEIIGGIGSTLERQFAEFETQAKERLRIARQYGFDVTKIEQRNAEDRAKLVDQILAERVGGLQQLLEDLKFGDLFEGSAADRRDKLLAEIATAKTDAEQGVDGAADRLADLTRQLVETSRDAYGTAGSEYASDRASAISNAEAIIAAENERIKAAQQATLDTSKAMQTQNQLTNETNDILSEIRALLRTGAATGSYAGLVAGGLVDRSVDLS